MSASIFVTFLLTSSYLLYFTPLIICLRTMADGYYFFFNLCNTGNRRYFLWIVSFRRELDINVNTFSWLESYVVNLLMSNELDRYSLCQPPQKLI